MNSYQIKYYEDLLKYMYNEEHNFHDPSLDTLTNAEYITHMAQPSYAVVVSLIKILPHDCIREILQYMVYKGFTGDLSARTARRLYKSILDQDFSRFKFIYDKEYMQYNISNWFEFDDESPGYKWNFYSLCRCVKEEPIKIHRHLYVHRCHCLNGKRYLASIMVEDLTTETPSLLQCNQSGKNKQIEDYIIESGDIITNYKSLVEI